MENQDGGRARGQALKYTYLVIGMTYLQNSDGYAYIFQYIVF